MLWTVLSVVVLLSSVATSLELDEFIGLQHFQPCYYIDADLPCLLDGSIVPFMLLFCGYYDYHYYLFKSNQVEFVRKRK